MIVIEKKKVQGIPLLEIVRKDLYRASLPTIFFYHGYKSAKEHNLHYAYLFAEKNYRVVLPEVIYHGERAEGDEETNLDFRFWEIIIKSIHELESLKNDYVHKQKTKEDSIGVAGTSMGGIITLGALTQYHWIKVAVSLMGNPSYLDFAKFQIELYKEILPFPAEEVEKVMQQLAPYDLNLHPEKLAGRPLLFWHGKLDKTVPYSGAYNFYKKMKENNDFNSEHIRFILDEKAEHKVSRAGLLASQDWFERYLK